MFLAAGVAAFTFYIGVPAFGLVFPHTPASTRSMRFDGFIKLPAGADRGVVSALDYLTVEGRHLFAAGIWPGAIYRVPLLPGKGLASVGQVAVMRGAPIAHGTVFDPTTGMGFASRSGENTVDMFDPKSLTVKRRIPVPPDVDGIFFDPFDRLVYAVSGEPKVGTFIDARRGTVVGHVLLGGVPESAVYDRRTRAFYQNLTDTNYVAEVDPLGRFVAHQWFLDGCEKPSGIALDEVNGRLLIACHGNSVMVVFSLAKHRVVASVPVGGGPDVLGYDIGLGRIYTTGLAGELSMLEYQKGRIRALERISLEFAAHTLAIDPTTHRLYVGYLSLLRDPCLAVFSPRT